jgi:hypothetical protein
MVLLLLALAVGVPSDPCAASAFLVERTGVSVTDTTMPQAVPPGVVAPFSDDDRALLPIIDTAITQALPAHRCLKELTDVVRALTLARHRHFNKFRPADDAGLFTTELYDQLLRLPHAADERARLTYFRTEMLWEIGRFRDAEAGYRRVIELDPAGELARRAAVNRVFAAKAHLKKRPSPNQEKRDHREKERLHPQLRPPPPPPRDTPVCDTVSSHCFPVVSEPFTADEQLVIDAVDAYLTFMPLPPPTLQALARAPLSRDKAEDVRQARHTLEERAAVALDGGELSARRGHPDARARLETVLDLDNGDDAQRFEFIAAFLVDHVAVHEPATLLPLLDRLDADPRSSGRLRERLVDVRARAQSTPTSTSTSR